MTGSSSPASVRDNRSGASAVNATAITSSGVKTSGISCEATNGSAVSMASRATRASEAQAEAFGSSTRRNRCSNQAASTAWAMIGGHKVCCRCSGYRNRL